MSTKRIDFFDGAQSSTTPDFAGLDSSGLVQYANDAAYEADNAGSPVGGNAYYNTTLDAIRYYDENASAWTSVVSELQKGAANGVAPLNGSSKIEATYLPGYVDDVEEYANLASFPVTGETGKIYVAIDTERTYRWTGSVYTEISPNSITSVNGATGVVVLDTEDLNDVSFTSLAAREILRRNIANTEFENVNLDSVANDNATGSNQTLSAISTSIVRLTNASLTSVDMIPAGFDGQKCIIINASTVSVNLNNETGATAANRILTGIGANLTVGADANIWLTYDGTTSRWRVVGGTGASGANTTLSNLTSPTAINQDLIMTAATTLRMRNNVYVTARNAADSANQDLIKLDTSNNTTLNTATSIIPSASDSKDIGLLSNRWRFIVANGYVPTHSNGQSGGQITANNATPSGAGAAGGVGIAVMGLGGGYWAGLFTIDNASLSGPVHIETGNASGGNSGAINIRTGTASGTRGHINLNAPTINVFGSIVPNADATYTCGGLFTNFSQVYTNNVSSNTGNLTVGSNINTTFNASFVSGELNSASSSGQVSLRTGNNTGAGATGNVNINSGNATSGNSGNIAISTGTAGGTRGDITLAASRIDASASPGPFRSPNLSADPGSPLNGDIWYNTTTNELKARVNGVTVVLA